MINSKQKEVCRRNISSVTCLLDDFYDQFKGKIKMRSILICETISIK